MANFNKNNDPKVISNLSSNHADARNLNNNKLYQPKSMERRDSSTFHETKIKYQENLVTDYSKMKGKNISMPKVEYTEEKILTRPVEDKNKIMHIESKEKEMPKFTKSVTENMANPVHELFQNAQTSTETIKEEKVEQKPNKKKKKSSKFTLFIIIGIILEIIILGVIYLVKELNSKEILECTSKNYNSYYGATITNTKKYYFKNNKITKLEDTVEYLFDNKELYESYKKDYATPPYSAIDGRIIVTNINDNASTYIEKATYDYGKLRNKNESSDSHNIVINNDKSYDNIYLIDYNITDIKIIYGEEYTCR